MSNVKNGEKRLGYFPLLGEWDVCEARVSEMQGLEVIEWVDQWNNEPYETADGTIDQPRVLLPLPEVDCLVQPGGVAEMSKAFDGGRND